MSNWNGEVLLDGYSGCLDWRGKIEVLLFNGAIPPKNILRFNDKEGCFCFYTFESMRRKYAFYRRESIYILEE